MESLYQIKESKNKPAASKEAVLPVTLSPAVVNRWLLGITFLLLIANIVAIAFKQLLVQQTKLTWYFDRFFNFNYENNFPSFFSSVLLVAAAGILLLLYVISKHQQNNDAKFRWLLLSLVFLFLAIDENIQIHELLAKVVRPRLASDLSGLLYWAWVVPYFIAFVVIVAYFLPFVLRLPTKTRNLIILSGFMFVFGAVGLELAEGYVYKKYGLEHLYNQLLYCVEELLEMTGVILFIHALSNHIAAMNISILPKNEVVITAKNRA
jgi:hypothetical protein